MMGWLAYLTQTHVSLSGNGEVPAGSTVSSASGSGVIFVHTLVPVAPTPDSLDQAM